MHRTTRLKITELNQRFICVLCDGYLIDATTIIECLHSFCRTCIVRYLENSRYCPVCDVQVQTKPLQSIRSDTTLQDVVYKLIPGLYQNEMQRRREFYAQHPEEAAKCSSEERGEGAEQRCFYSPKENISVTLEYFQGTENVAPSDTDSNSDTNSNDLMTRYLNCPAALTIGNLKKFIRMKFSLPSTYRVELMYDENLLIDDYTLMDIAYIYSWRRAGPMKFLYTFSHRKYLPKRVLEPAEKTAAAETDVPPVDDIVREPVIIPNVSEDSDSSNKPSSEDSAMDESDESNRPVAETNAVVTDESNSSSGSVAVAKTGDESNSDSNTPVAVASIPAETDNKSEQTVVEPEKMEAEEASSGSSCIPIPHGPTWASTVQVEATYAPQNTVFPQTNGIKLKLVPLPDTCPKARSKKSTGRKGGRTRYKSTPVQRFPRLAPYPPKPHTTTSAACLSSPNMPPLPQITMGKLVPSVINTLAPNIVTALVSTTANSMRDVTKNSTMLPTATFLSQSPLCAHSNTFAAVPNFIPSSSSAVNTTILPKVSGANVTVKPILAQAVVGNTVSSSETPILPTTTVQISVADNKNIISQPTTALQSTTSASGAPRTTSSMEVSVPKEQPLLVNVPKTVPPSMPIISIAPSQPEPMEVSTAAPIDQESPSILKTVLSEKQPRDSKTPSPKTVPSGAETKIECNGVQGSATFSPVEDALFGKDLSPEKKASKAFEMSVKNSISAEFSDNDDLGCQPDLVVDEQKMDSSDNEDDTDTALRKQITAIAEKEDEADATDDTEADSGRASDISSQARSSCDDDIGSPMNTMPVSETVTSTASSRLPTFTLAVPTAPTLSTDNTHPVSSRSVKSIKIDNVINNLYLKSHERKDSVGALDLSTCTNLSTKKPGEEAAARPKHVANPVLDIKHRQQTYLPAPNSKQHTACVPSPKHPTTSPILMHGLTAHRHAMLPSQIPGVNRKSPHLPVPTFHSTPMVYPSQSRGISSPSCLPGRSPTPTTSPLLSHHSSTSPHTLSPPVPTAHQGMPAMLTGILPCMSKSVMSAFPLRSATPAPSVRSSNSNSSSSGKSFFSKGLNRSLSNPSKSMMTNSATAYMAASLHKSSNSPISGYKRSNSYKSYNGKYAVINPDPNGYQNKMLIRNLDARPNTNNSQQSHKL